MSEIMFIFYWWFAIFVIGLAFLPLTTNIFNKFLDKGYIFSKILGIAILSYFVFVLGIFHLIVFSKISCILLIILFFFLNYLIFGKNRNKQKFTKNVFSLFSKNWKLFILEEIIFIVALLFWTAIKGYQPDIHGLEKYMDFGFVNSILRAKYFPAKDIWFTPLSINYYYFGHLVTAILTKISSVPSQISFNLMLATLFAFTFAASFSLGINFANHLDLKKKISKRFILFSGFLTAFLVTLAGNLHTIFIFFKAYSVENPVPFWQLEFLPSTFPNSYWYPNATRFIYNTIHEFPIYSWVVSDLHGHVLDIPFVLLTIALLFSMFLLFGKTNPSDQSLNYIFNLNPKNIMSNLKLLFIKSWQLILLSFLLSVMYMTNAWDGAIYLLFAGLIFLFISFKNNNKKGFIINYSIKMAIIFVFFIIFSLPFNFFFEPFVSGIGLLCAPDFLINIGKFGPFLFESEHCQTSPLWQLSILYGFFYFLIISFFVLVFRKKAYKNDFFITTLIMFSTILIFIPEIIYIKDIYPAHFRANTMFKLVYQSFILLSLCSGYMITRIIVFLKKRKGASKNIIQISWTFIFISFFTLIMTYPFFAINSYYADLKNYQGLDGTRYLSNLYPNDYKAILWINKNIKNQPVILEAQGDSYTDFGRISANSGLPTVLGWTVHEWLWRGSYDIPSPRIEEVKILYETEDRKKARKIIKKYNIELIFIGELEKEKYQNLNEDKFKDLGKIIYKNPEVNIYQILP
ncbi:MAG: DUF2298 domain-containing protein [Candidatus Levyibacteriota bacterium]